MTNTILGAVFLLSAILLITLFSCNRNNTKSEITNTNELNDTTKMAADSVSNSIDTLITQTEQTDTIGTDTITTAKTVIAGEKLITDEDEDEENKPETITNNNTETLDSVKENIANESATNTSQKLSLKENIDKTPKTPKTPTTGKSEAGGIKASTALKDRQNKNAGKRILFVGSGGGVTGAVNEYRIDIEGSVYEKKSLGENATRKKGLKIEQLQKINQQFDALNFDSLKYNNPGNLYYFIGYELNGKKHQITWGGTEDEVSEKVKAYYDFVINQLIK